MVRTFLLAGAALTLAACDCLPQLGVPCPGPGPSIVIKVTPVGRAGAIEGLVVDSSGAATKQATCSPEKSDLFVDGGFAFVETSTQCLVNGPAGTYELKFSAPGYQPLTRSVTVAAHGACGCDDGIEEARMTVELTPSP